MIQIRTMAPPILATAHQEILTIGTAQLGRLTVFTRENAKPLGVQHFAPLANLPPARHIQSEILALSDIAPATPVTVSGGDAVLRINGGGWVSSGTMNPGDRVQLRMTSPGSGLASVTATLDIGGIEREWRLTTLDTNARVRAFAIPATTGAIPGSSAISRAIYITGNKAPVTVSVTGSGSPEIRVGIGPWAQSAEVSPGERIQLRAIAPSGTGASRSISVTAGDYVTSWTVSTGR